MIDEDATAESLLQSPLGCAFVLLAHSSNLSPEAASRPAVALHMAARAVTEVSTWRQAHADTVRQVMGLARGQRQLARRILEQPLAAAWFAPFDRTHQVWFSRHGAELDATRLAAPSSPPTRWERYAQKPASGLYTSTLVEGTTSVFAAICEGAMDLQLQIPADCWKLSGHSHARIYELDSPVAWHALCARYAAAGLDGRLVPDWAQVATDWDAVHLSLGGLLTSEQVRVNSPAGWSLHTGWDAEQTIWFRWMFRSAKPLRTPATRPADLHLKFP